MKPRRIRARCMACGFRGARGPVVLERGIFVADKCPGCGSADVEVMTPEWRTNLLSAVEYSGACDHARAVEASKVAA